jgi:hypothetical protein
LNCRKEADKQEESQKDEKNEVEEIKMEELDGTGKRD